MTAGEVRTGDWFYAFNYPTMHIAVSSAVASAVDGIEIEWAETIGNVSHRQFLTFTPSSPDGEGETFYLTRRQVYVRVNYTNGGDAGDVSMLVYFPDQPTRVSVETPEGEPLAVAGVETTGSGTLTGGADVIDIDTQGMAMLTLQLNGTFTAGEIYARSSQDDFASAFEFENEFYIGFWHSGTQAGNLAPAMFYDGVFVNIPCAGVKTIRLESFGTFVGSLTVTWRATSIPGLVRVAGHASEQTGTPGAIGDAVADATGFRTVTRNLPSAFAHSVVWRCIRGWLFNGVTWDRERNNRRESLLAAANRTASINTADQTNYNARGVAVWLNVTTAAAAENLTLIVQGRDAASGLYFDMFTSAPLTATGLYGFQVYPGFVGGASGITGGASLAVPRVYRVRVAHSAGGTWNYSVGVDEVV